MLNRLKGMTKQQRVTLVVGLLGSAKLIGQAFGYNFHITDDQVNMAANVVASVVDVAIGLFMNHTVVKQ